MSHSVSQNRLISFPKSGRTWLRVMLTDLAIPVRATHDGADHRHHRALGAFSRNKWRYFLDTVLLLIRDPRDTAVSGYFQLTKRIEPVNEISRIEMGEFLRSPLYGIAKTAQFNMNWFAAATWHRQLAILSYEDMSSDTFTALKRVAEFYGHPKSDKCLAAAVENNTFDNLQQRERTGEAFRQYGSIFAKPGVDDADSMKVRRGKVGGYLDALSPADIEYCDDILARMEYWPARERAQQRARIQ